MFLSPMSARNESDSSITQGVTIDSLLERLSPYAAGLVGVSLFLFVACLVALPILVTRLRSDYFVNPEPPSGSVRASHPFVALLLRLLKNALGVVFVVAGLLMLVLPGQGLLTIFMGVTLLDFPGKRNFEVRIVRKKPVRRALDWMRTKAGKPPFQLP